MTHPRPEGWSNKNVEEAGEDTSNMAESTSKLRAQVAALTNIDGKGGFDIMQDEDTYKNLYDIMLGISKVWNDMTDIKQSALLELLAGKVRSNQVAALLNNMSRAEEILKTSENSAGTMEEVHARWLDSIAAKQAQLTASWENLSQTVVNSDMIKMFYGGGANILNALDSLISKIGAIGPAFGALGTIGLAKLGGGNALTGFASLLPFGSKSSGKVDGNFVEQYNKFYGQTLDKTVATQKAISAMQESMGGANYTMNGATEFALKYSKGLIQVGDGATVAGMKIKALGGVFKGLLANLGAMAAISAVMWALGKIAEAWNNTANAEQLAVQAADDATASWQESKDEVSSLEQELANVEAQYQALVDKGPLNFTDEQTKNDLRQQTEELRTQLMIARQLEAERGNTAYDMNKAAWEKQYEMNMSLPALLSNIGTTTDGEQYVKDTRQELNDIMASFYDLDEREMSAVMSEHMLNAVDEVVDQTNKYMEKGFVGNDIKGSLAMFNYLQDMQNQAADQIMYWQNRAVSGDEMRFLGLSADMVYQNYADISEATRTSAAKLKAQLITEYQSLNDRMEQMELRGETTTELYTRMREFRDAIGTTVIPDIHSNRVLLELRKTDSGFAATYDRISEMAKSVKITEDVLNDTKFDKFRGQLKAAGIDIENFIGLMQELYVAGAPELSTTTASGLSKTITDLLGFRQTGATIRKNTGYGTRGISEEDYQSLVDMGDYDFLKAVESSHGTIWFNQDTFNKEVVKKLNDASEKMYADMISKQSEYVQQAKKLQDALAEYTKYSNENVADVAGKTREEQLKLAKESIANITKNMTLINQEIDLYNRLAAQIKDATSAYSKWQMAKGGPQEGDDYDEALEAYKALEEGYKSGRVGNLEYKAAQEYLLGAGGDYYGSEKQRKLLARYLTKSAPGKSEDTGYGARNFWNDAVGLGILDKNGRLKGERTSEEIGRMMGISSELVEHMFGELNEFIADESKKYKLKSPTLEEQAQAPDYTEFVKSSNAFKEAVAKYNSGEGDMAGLIKAWYDYQGKASEQNIDATTLMNSQIVASTSDLTSATNANTAALMSLAALIASLNMPDGERKPRIAYSDGQHRLVYDDGTPVTDASGNAVVGLENVQNYLYGLTEKYGNIVTEAEKQVIQINKEAAQAGLKTRLKLDDDGRYRIYDTNGNIVGKKDGYELNIDAVAEMWNETAQKASTMVEAFNALAASKGIENAMGYDNGQWTVNGNPVESLAAAISGVFGDYITTERDNATKMTAALETIAGGKITLDMSNGNIILADGQAKPIGDGLAQAMADSGTDFGNSALAAWQKSLTDLGINKALGINENGKFTVDGEEYDLAGMLQTVFGGISTAGSVDVIESTLRAMGRTETAKYNKDTKQYDIFDQQGNFVKSYTSTATALNDIAGEAVTSLASAIESINSYLTEADSSLRATVEAGQQTITDTATGEKQTFGTLTLGATAVISSSVTSIQSTLDRINEIGGQYTGVADKAAEVKAATETLNEALSTGASEVTRGLNALNDALSAEGILDKIGMTADGQYSFGDKLFETLDEVIAAAFGDIMTAPKKSVDVLNGVLEKMGDDRSFSYDSLNGVYRLSSGEVYTSAQEAMTEITSGSMSELASLVVAINDAYATAGENIQFSIEKGQGVLTNVVTGAQETYTQVDTALNLSANNAFASLESVAASLSEINVNVTADGKFTLVDSNGQAILGADGQPQTFDNFSDTLKFWTDTTFGGLTDQLGALTRVMNDNFGIEGNGKFFTRENGQKFIQSNLTGALNQSMQTILGSTVTETIRSIMGAAAGFDENGKLTFNGNVYDSFVKMMQDGWDSTVFTEYNKKVQDASEAAANSFGSFTDAAGEDTTAFNDNASAVRAATSALSAFNAALAVNPLNGMLAQEGRGGSFMAGKDGSILYFDEMGRNTGIFKTPEDAFNMMFGDYGEWKLGQDKKGNVTATKSKIGEDGKAISTYTEDIGKITSAKIDESGMLTLNDAYRIANSEFDYRNGKLFINADGSEVLLGDVESVTAKDGTTTFEDKNGNALLSTYGMYARATNGGLVQRPEYDATGKLLATLQNGAPGTGDYSLIRQVLDYVDAAGDSADAEAKAIVDAFRDVVAMQESGELFDEFAEEYADRFGLTDETRRTNQMLREREQHRQEVENSSAYRLAEQYKSGNINDDELLAVAQSMFDFNELTSRFAEITGNTGARKPSSKDVLRFLLNQENIDNLAAKDLETGTTFDDALSAYRAEQERIRVAAEEAAREAAEAEAARIAAEEASRKAQADGRKKTLLEEIKAADQQMADAEAAAAARKAALAKEAEERQALLDQMFEENLQNAQATNAAEGIIDGDAIFTGIGDTLRKLAVQDTETFFLSPIRDLLGGIGELFSEEASQNRTDAVNGASEALADFFAGIVYGAEDTATSVYKAFTEDAPDVPEPKFPTAPMYKGTQLYSPEGYAEKFGPTEEEKVAQEFQKVFESLSDSEGDLHDAAMMTMKSMYDFDRVRQEYKGGAFKDADDDSIATVLSSMGVNRELFAGVTASLADFFDQLVKNVNLRKRPQVGAEKMRTAGYDVGDDDIATLYSMEFSAGTDGEPYNQDIILHMTPILSNGEVLDEDAMYDYVSELLQNDTIQGIVNADKPENGGKGLLLWLQQVQEGWDAAFEKASAYDEALHITQEEMMNAPAPNIEPVTAAVQEVSEEPVTVDVNGDTAAAQQSINALDGQSGTYTVNIQYNDPGYRGGDTGEPINIADPRKSGKASASGTSSADPGMSLVDEQGAELIEHVSEGTYELGTDNGPRFTNLNKGDIVHNAEETKKIKRRGLIGRVFDAFRNGGVKRGGAFASMRAREDAFVFKTPGKSSLASLVDGSGDILTTAGTTNKKGGGGGKKGGGIKAALEWAEKLVDWIPTALELLKKKTSDYIKSSEKSIGHLAQNSELTKAIQNVRAELDLNTQAVNRYKKQAEDFASRAGLAADVVKKIQEGTIDIEEYDEETRKAIQTYQTWWDKAKGCEETIESLNDQLYDLSKQKLDNIVNSFGNIDEMLNQQIDTFNKLIEVKEAYGQEMTKDDYLDAIKLTESVIKNLGEEQNALQTELTDQVNAGIIKVGSDDWYNYAKQIEELNSTISDAKVNLSELNDEARNITMNNLQTSIYYLDNLQNKIEGLQRLREAQGGNAEINSYRNLISAGMKQIDNLREQNNELRDQMQGLDVLSEKYQELNKQLQDNEDKIMDIKANQEEWNDAILDLKIEVLEKQNDEYQRQIDLMNALNELEDARQRRVLLYDNQQGFHYVADEDALEDAQDAINDQMYQMVIDGLEKQKTNNNIYDNMGNQLLPVTDVLSGIDFTRYYDTINRGSEVSSLLTSMLKSIDMPEILEGTTGGDVSIDIGDIVLNGVNDAKELGDAIIAQLPGYLVQAIYSKGA